jgi:hypothetical protein
MTCLKFQAAAALIAVMAVAGLVRTGDAQAPAAQKSQPAATPRTPWGDPNLQGIWDVRTTTPLERPAKFSDREFLTEEEVNQVEAAARKAAAAPVEAVVGRGRDVRAERGTEADVEGAYNNIFSTGFGGRYLPTRRTSVIIDPPDGKRPPFTEEGKKLLARASAEFVAGPDGDIPNPDFRGTRRGRGASPAGGRGGSGAKVPYAVDIGRPNDNPEDRNDLERCTGVSLPCTGGLCSFQRLVQTPGYVTIYYEMGHSGGGYRTIPITNRPHLPQSVRQWFGDSVARWEGDTLVVDTTNFTDKTAYAGVGDEKLHMIERFKRLNDSDLQYQLTINKPNVYSRPFTMEYIYLRADEKANKIYESQCYEGNYALTAMLAGQRALDREKAAAAKAGRAKPGAATPTTAKPGTTKP